MNPTPIFISGLVCGFLLAAFAAETKAFEVSQVHAAEVQELRNQQLDLPPDFAEKVRLIRMLGEPILTRAAQTPVVKRDDVGALIASLED